MINFKRRCLLHTCKNYRHAAKASSRYLPTYLPVKTANPQVRVTMSHNQQITQMSKNFRKPLVKHLN